MQDPAGQPVSKTTTTTNTELCSKDCTTLPRQAPAGTLTSWDAEKATCNIQHAFLCPNRHKKPTRRSPMAKAAHGQTVRRSGGMQPPHYPLSEPGLSKVVRSAPKSDPGNQRKRKQGGKRRKR
eukprot:scaffold37464_cov31-Tisochrysis_lutea.AAC.4